MGAFTDLSFDSSSFQSYTPKGQHLPWWTPSKKKTCQIDYRSLGYSRMVHAQNVLAACFQPFLYFLLWTTSDLTKESLVFPEAPSPSKMICASYARSTTRWAPPFRSSSGSLAVFFFFPVRQKMFDRICVKLFARYINVYSWRFTPLRVTWNLKNLFSNTHQHWHHNVLVWFWMSQQVFMKVDPKIQHLCFPHRFYKHWDSNRPCFPTELWQGTTGRRPFQLPEVTKGWMLGGLNNTGSQQKPSATVLLFFPPLKKCFFFLNLCFKRAHFGKYQGRQH